jgi:hypothetical protein
MRSALEHGAPSVGEPLMRSTHGSSSGWACHIARSYATTAATPASILRVGSGLVITVPELDSRTSAPASVDWFGGARG